MVVVRVMARLIPRVTMVLALLAGWLMVRGSRQLVGGTGLALLAEGPAQGIAPLFTPEVRHWERRMAVWAEEAGVEANLAATVMQIESCGWPRAVSSAGARGLFQVMPYHFADGEDMTDPDSNARRGLAYLAGALRLAGGDAALALAGYNGGHGMIHAPGSRWPAETRRYVYWGAGIYADAAQGRAASARLDEWLAAGGAGLCARAARALGLP